MAWAFGSETEWDFDDAKIAKNNGNGTFGTQVDVYSTQMASMATEIRSGTATGDGIKTAMASKIIGITGSIRFVGIQYDVLAVLMNMTQASSGSTPNALKRMALTGGSYMPYISLHARVLTGAGGSAHLWIPQLKLMEDIETNFEEENFVTIEASFEGKPDPNVLAGGLPVAGYLFHYETATAIAIPPTSIPLV